MLWALLCVSAAIWGFGGVKFSTAGSLPEARLWFKIAYVGVIFAPVFYTHFVFSYLNLKRRLFVAALYLLGGIFLIVNIFFHKFLIADLNLVFGEFYWHAWYKQKNILWLFFYITFYWVFLVYAFYCLMKRYRFKAGGQREQLKYLIFGSAVGWLGPHGAYILDFGIPVYPYANFFMAVYPLIIAYAIIRHRLMDISVVITRTTIFIFVYSVVLGLPFLLALVYENQLMQILGEKWWIAPLTLMTLLATAGPFIYLAIQKRAEEKLFQDQRRYQSTLRQAATGMGRIKDMERLIGLIVHIVTRSVRIEQSVVFLKDRSGKKYTFEGGRWRHQKVWKIKDLDARLPFIRALSKTKQPLVYSELMQEMAANPSEHLKQVLEQMETLEAELIVPSFVDENLIAFMVLGRKVSAELYTDDDIAVFSILASQAALAIENCQFYRDMRSTHEQLFKAEKMATIGIMADGLSHQINNRLHALGFIAGDALDTLHLNKDLPMTEQLKEVMVDLEHALNRIQENVMQGGEIVRGLLKYSRKQDEKFSEVDIGELVEEAFKMAQFKIKKDSMDLVQNFPPNLPRIQGNFTELQEVFFNLFDNAYDAMMQRKEELQEEGYRPTIEISAEPRGSRWLNIILKDNGMGIKPEDQHKVFTPFFTTKLSSKKGTGLGLYVIRKLIEENHKGKVVYRSEYMKGTRVYVALPACGLANV